MARAKQNEKPTTVRTASSSRGVRTASRSTVILLGASALAALWAVTMLTGAAQTAYAYGFFFTEFFAGVIALVSLSLTVMMGLLATDRLVLLIRHRVLLQSAHRATGILGVAGLVFHVITKIASGRAGPTDALVPFVGGRGIYVGLGTVAALLMVSVLWTGLIRARFAGVGPKWLWRVLHSTAYASWPFAIVHGLNAGRPATSWVTLSYLACVLLVVVALLVRLSVALQRTSREQQQAAVLNAVMTGRGSEDTRGNLLLGAITRRRGEDEERREKRTARETSWADSTSGTWAGPTVRRTDPERFTVPVVPEPGTLREPVRPGRRQRAEDLEPATGRSARRKTEERETARRYRREEDVEPVVRGSRREEDVEPVVRRSRRADESVGRRASRRDEDLREEEPARRRRREEEDAPSRRSRSDVDAGTRYSAPPQPLDEPEEPWDSPRRWTAGRPISAGPISGSPISAAPRSGGGRHSVDDDLPEEEPDYWRPPARYLTDDVPADDTPTLVDLASRREARRSARDPRRRRANADAVDGAYWAGLRGEAR
ncbi:hypothetical protein GA0070616_1170 [Micromonospora nigra]|uniref:DMSO/TMAO reductase YedYZ, heme-binding membrane subunit n=2 Tax=Micromonospora nigra TaxID=145857 RepID=A0A1C6RIV3_9ACTN|nr:hypothetical protein GA0070616_1170 [Micromonospora nigra]